MKSLYMIGSLRNRAGVTQVAKEIRTLGLEAFDDWLAPGPKADDNWKEYEEDRGRTYKEALNGWAAQHVFAFDHHHLDRVDGAVLILPAGKSCHLEAGYIVGSGKPLFILMDAPDRWDVMNLFAQLNGGGIAFDIEELKDVINAKMGS